MKTIVDPTRQTYFLRIKSTLPIHEIMTFIWHDIRGVLYYGCQLFCVELCYVNKHLVSTH